MRYTLSILAFGALVACSPEEDTPGTPVSTTPETYEFTRGGVSTVNISGQVIRQNMLAELSNEIKSGTSATLDYQTLVDMYENTNNPFSDTELNTSGKSLSSKTSASPIHSFDQGTTINWFKAIMQDAADASAASTTASAGVAGVISNTDGSRNYLVAANGLEYAQIVQKGMMGAVLMDQMVNNYLTDLKLNVDNDPANGNPYTDMEHHWDEGYGYFSKVQDYSADESVSQDRGFWGGYLLELEEDFHYASDVYLAFRTGRQAIVEEDYTERDNQITIIADGMEQATYIKAISYLNKGAQSLAANNAAVAFHQLSEGVGFIYSLRFTASETISPSQSDALINELLAGDGFWEGDIQARITSVRNQIGTAFNVSNDILEGTY